MGERTLGESEGSHVGERVRVLVVDDSALCRDLLVSVLRRDAGIEVVGAAADGEEALALTRALRPHVITMDLRMPRVDGIQATRAIMAELPTAILVVTGHPFQSGRDMTFEALRAGALDLVIKPALGNLAEVERVAGDLARLVRFVSKVEVKPRTDAPTPSGEPALHVASRRPVSVVAIASSAGGPRAVHALLQELPERFGAPIVVAQHIASGFSREFAAWLDGACALTVRQAQDGDVVRAGLVLVAPAETSLSVGRGGTCRLVPTPGGRGEHTSADVLLSSVALQYGETACGVVLSGMGDDGVEGLSRIKARGGVTLAQDAATSVVHGMARAAMERGVVDAVLPVARLAATLRRLCPLQQVARAEGDG